MNNQLDKNEFLKLIQSNKGIIFKICNSYCHNQSDREDLAQEITYELWKSGKSFNTDYTFSTWMYRVALNVAISFYRKWKKRAHVMPFAERLFEIEDKDDRTAVTEEKINQLQRFINELKELDRALMILYLDSKTYNEIAEILGITATNVATKINRIKDKMKQKFITTK
jgi:RNA polymerase sigma factor (sigma-70 family)